jgi:acid phosphatase
MPMLSALRLFPDREDLPTTHVARERAWRTSQIAPMGGRIIFERLQCSSLAAKADAKPSEEVFVRINVNDGIVPFGNCDSGPGRSCPLAHFLDTVRARGSAIGEFRSMCGLASDAPDRITFLHQ